MEEVSAQRGIMGLSRLVIYHTIHDYLIKHPELLKTERGKRLHDKIVDLLLAERRQINNFEFENRKDEYDAILNYESVITLAEHGDEVEKIGALVALLLQA